MEIEGIVVCTCFRHYQLSDLCDDDDDDNSAVVMIAEKVSYHCIALSMIRSEAIGC